MGKIGNEPVRHATQPDERAELGLSSEVLELLHCVREVLCEFQEAKPNNMAKIVNSLSDELTFLHLQCNYRLVEQSEHASDLFDVVHGDFENTAMSSKQTKADCHRKEASRKLWLSERLPGRSLVRMASG